jgi:hypothetical protein
MVSEATIIDEEFSCHPGGGEVCQQEYRHLDKNEATVAYYRAPISRGGLIRIERQRRVASP